MLSKIRSFLTIPILLLFGLGLAYITFDEQTKQKALLDHGKTTQAAVEKVEWNKKRSTEKDFKVFVKFETETKQPVSTSIKVSNELGKKIRDDNNIQTVAILYLPEKPATAAIAGDTQEFGIQYGLAAALIVGAIGLFFYRRRSAAKEAAAPAVA
ncbi:MAG: hypothetical protein RLZZ618_3544 [Pseudomonadota bacterium]|jgi:cytochrome bd-type quinol oxidase subunit 1